MSGPDVDLDDLMAQLRATGLRATTARRAVLEALLNAGDSHLVADELAERIHTDHPEIHLSTVYRTLDSLADAGLVNLARFHDRPATYHLAVDVHHHAVCTQCGDTLNLPAGVLAPVIRGLAKRYGFRAEPRHLTIVGRCATCAAGYSNSKP